MVDIFFRDFCQQLTKALVVYAYYCSFYVTNRGDLLGMKTNIKRACVPMKIRRIGGNLSFVMPEKFSV